MLGVFKGLTVVGLAWHSLGLTPHSEKVASSRTNEIVRRELRPEIPRANLFHAEGPDVLVVESRADAGGSNVVASTAAVDVLPAPVSDKNENASGTETVRVPPQSRPTSAAPSTAIASQTSSSEKTNKTTKSTLPKSIVSAIRALTSATLFAQASPKATVSEVRDTLPSSGMLAQAPTITPNVQAQVVPAPSPPLTTPFSQAPAAAPSTSIMPITQAQIVPATLPPLATLSAQAQSAAPSTSIMPIAHAQVVPATVPPLATPSVEAQAAAPSTSVTPIAQAQVVPATFPPLATSSVEAQAAAPSTSIMPIAQAQIVPATLPPLATSPMQTQALVPSTTVAPVVQAQVASFPAMTPVQTLTTLLPQPGVAAVASVPPPAAAMSGVLPAPQTAEGPAVPGTPVPEPIIQAASKAFSPAPVGSPQATGSVFSTSNIVGQSSVENKQDTPVLPERAHPVGRAVIAFLLVSGAIVFYIRLTSQVKSFDRKIEGKMQTLPDSTRNYSDDSDAAKEPQDRNPDIRAWKRPVYRKSIFLAP